MGTCLTIHSVSDKNIKKIGEQPELIWRLIEPDDSEPYEDALEENNKVDILDLEFVDGENIYINLDILWQGVHYCFNKIAPNAIPPMNFLMTGGDDAGDIEIGYGPVRLFDSKTLKEIHQILSKITETEFSNNYNPKEMDELDIYPNTWEDDSSEGLKNLYGYFISIKEFISNCNNHNLGMAIYLS